MYRSGPHPLLSMVFYHWLPPPLLTHHHLFWAPGFVGARPTTCVCAIVLWTSKKPSVWILTWRTRHVACAVSCRQRDAIVGGAIPTELCQAVQSSHCWALLITPNFLLDDWCQYMMHQALSEGPMSNWINPLVLTLPYSQYPKELRFYYYKDLSKNPERGYTQVYKTVLKCE